MSDATTFSLPRINETAPDFTARTTHGELTLSDYRGKWVVLFSHPADFTPVCTTEFIGFAREHETFKGLNTELIGLSIDSVHSHIAWVRNIDEKFGVQIPFPVIADLKMDVSKLYGMIHPGASETAAVRAVFVIDPEQKIRAMIYYPLTTGRWIKEVVRLVQALQANHETGLATPEGWRPGDDFIVPPPGTQAEAAERMKSDYELTDWYFAKTQNQ